jgi:hypothetical protein
LSIEPRNARSGSRNTANTGHKMQTAPMLPLLPSRIISRWGNQS